MENIKNSPNRTSDIQEEHEEETKELLRTELVFGIITIIFFLLTFVLSVYMIENLNLKTIPIIAITISFLLFILSMTYCLKIEQKAGFYMCAKCNHKHVPTFKQVLFAPHYFRTRYLKCPNCKRRSWQKKVIK